MAADVTSTSRHTDVDEPGVKLAIVDPIAGRFDHVRPISVQLLSLTFLTLCVPGDPLITNILSLTDWIICPANGPRSNFRYDSDDGEPSA
jgi:hypothetical protein